MGRPTEYESEQKMDTPKDPPLTTRLPDGTLWALEKYATDGNGAWIMRLVPLSAEAG